MQKYLREKLLPPHLMHCSNFSGRIYVEKTPEQCSLNHYSSQRAKEDVWWDMYLSEGLNDWQVCDQDDEKGDYISKKSPYGGRWEKRRREERERIIVASTLINSDFNNNPSPRIIISSILIFVSILDYSGDPD